MMNDVIQNPRFPSICTTNYIKYPLNIKFEVKMILGQMVSKISTKAIVVGFLWEDLGLLLCTNKTPSSLALSVTDRGTA